MSTYRHHHSLLQNLKNIDGIRKLKFITSLPVRNLDGRTLELRNINITNSQVVINNNCSSLCVNAAEPPTPPIVGTSFVAVILTVVDAVDE